MNKEYSIGKEDKKNFFKNLFGNNKVCIISKDIHKLDNYLIPIEAKKVIYRLKNFGYQAYIVGGAIRDLLLGRKPKDFDVVTNAKPKEIKKIFCNARLIGKRFKLVHIIFKNRIIEASTFRAESRNNNSIIFYDNKFGTIEEDVKRRDFSINALYYDIESENLIDYLKCYKDIKKRKIRTLKKASISFIEDPVRMIRAVKYSVLLNCKIDKKTFETIKKNAKEILKCSSFRLLEEINKIIKCENTKDIIIMLNKSKLLKYFIPIIEQKLNGVDSDLYLMRLERFDKEKIHFEPIYSFLELFWAIMLFEDVRKEINLDENLFFVIKNTLKDLLYNIKVPKKIVDRITKIYLNYIIIKDLSKTFPFDTSSEFLKDKLFYFIKRVKRTKYYNLLYYFLKIIGENSVLELFALDKSTKNKKYFKMVKTKNLLIKKD